MLSRQRAWGVPLAIFVRKGGHEILFDEEVNARIAAAFETGRRRRLVRRGREGALPRARSTIPDDYDKIDNLVEVWFDSGSTHAFVLEDPVHFPGLAGIRRNVDGGADEVMYLEGSDQHRGWFQSSLLESCGTRGRALGGRRERGRATTGTSRDAGRTPEEVHDRIRAAVDRSPDFGQSGEMLGSPSTKAWVEPESNQTSTRSSILS